MEKKQLFLTHLKHSIAAAILYCATAFVYIRQSVYEETWILYAGNMLFGAAIVIFLVLYNRRRNEKTSTIKMIKIGHITVLAGILLSAIICFILIMIIRPDIIQSAGRRVTLLKDAPVQMEGGKTNGFIAILLFNTLIGNFSAGSFVSVLFPFSLTRLQKGEGEPSGDVS